MFRSSFRAYRSYLAACVSAIDAFLNRLSWWTRNQPLAIAQSDLKLLLRRSLPLDEKLRKWIPVVTGKSIAEDTDTWTDYTAIKNARNAVVHINDPDFVFALQDAAAVLNLCRRGVGSLLLEICGLIPSNPAPIVLNVARAPFARYRPNR